MQEDGGLQPQQLDVNYQPVATAPTPVTSGKRLPDYQKALTFGFKDPKFVTHVVTIGLLLLSCIFILPILFVSPFILGYSVALVRNIQLGKYELPEMMYEEMWKRGLVVFFMILIVGFVLSLVPALLQALLVLATPGGSFSRVFQGSGTSTAAMTTSGLFVVLNIILSVFRFVLSIATGIVTLMMIVIYAKTLSLDSVMKIDNYNWLLKNSLVQIVIVMLIAVATAIVSVFTGMFLLCIGLPFTMAAGMICNYSMYGEIDVEGVK